MILEDNNIKLMKFPGGELHVQILDPEALVAQSLYNNKYQIDCYFDDNDDLMYIALIANAIRSVVPGILLSLNMPYFPYARQDRHTAYGSPFSLRIVADFINSLNFAEVIIADPHSSNTPLLVNNCFYRKPEGPLCYLAEKARSENFDNCIVVSPDAGAVKRTEAVAHKLGLPFAIAHKHRDPKTGQITSTSVYGDIPEGSNFLIFDDICDGGRTFTELAKVLKEKHKAKEIDLYVTFGIFSKGKEVFKDFRHVDAIYKFWENK